MAPTTPSQHRRQAVPLRRFRLVPFRSPLLRESLLLSSPRGTEMFQFPRFPPPVLCVQTGVTPHDGCGVSPFGYPRIEAWSAAPRGFSQPPTSFIGIWRQGIHRWLFIAWEFLLALVVIHSGLLRYSVFVFQRCSCSLCSSQGTGEAGRALEPAVGSAALGGLRPRGTASAAPSQRNSDAGAELLSPRWCRAHPPVAGSTGG